MPLQYRFSGAVLARLMGGVLAAAGAFVLVIALLTALLHLPALVLSIAVVVALLVFLSTGLLLTSVGAVLRLDETGYRVRLVRGAGVRQAPWKDVEDAAATHVGGHRCVVLRLRDGRTTTLPVDVLQGRPDDFVRTLQQHLNRGHGYRPLS